MTHEILVAVSVVALFAALAFAAYRVMGKRRPPGPPAAVSAVPTYQPAAPVDPLSSFDHAAAPYLREEIFRGFARHQADKWWADMADAAGKLGPNKAAGPPPPPQPPNP